MAAEDGEKKSSAPKTPIADVCLVDGNTGTYEQSSLDFVLVHELNGDSTRSWTSSSGFSISDVITRDIPGSRVFSCHWRLPLQEDSHDSYSIRELPTLLLNGLVALIGSSYKSQPPPISRKLVFIGHGVGGIIAKAMLFRAAMNPSWDYLSNSCAAVLFLGTPHRGVQDFDWVDPPLPALRTLTSPARDFLTALGESSDTLVKIDENFRQICNKYIIFSFYETRVSPVTKTLVVDKSNSILGLPNEQSFSSHKDHMHLTKFENSQDYDFRRLSRAVNIILKRALHMKVGNGTLHRVPSKLNDSTAGRESFSLSSVSLSSPSETNVLDDLPRMTITDFVTPAGSQDEPIRPRIPSFHPTIADFVAKGPSPCISQELGAAPYQKYVKDHKRHVRWIHVPVNNMRWVTPCVGAACRELGVSSSELLSLRNWLRKEQVTRHRTPHSAFMTPSYNVINSQKLKSSLGSRSQESAPIPPPDTTQPVDEDEPPITPLKRTSTSNVFHDDLNRAHEVRPNQFSLYLPYVHWDTFDCFSKRQAFYEKILKNKDTPIPLPMEAPSTTHQERYLAKEFLGQRYGLHPRRTLDQFAFFHLASTKDRDNDQIISHITERDEGGSRMIMVDQLWLWILNDETVVTFFPAKENSLGDFDEQADLKQAVLDAANETSIGKCSNAFELAVLIAEQAITVIFDQATNNSLKFLELYREALGLCTENQTKFYNRFYATIEESRKNVSSSWNVKSTRQILQDIEHKQEELQEVIRVADILDELKSLSRLLDIQSQVIGNCMMPFREILPDQESYVYGSTMERIINPIAEYQDQVKYLQRDAGDIHQALLTLLDLKQKEDSIDEARIARTEAEETATQGRSIILFTVVTIIFLPLSFFTSYFGMNVAEVTGSNANPTVDHVWRVAGPISAAIIVSALAISFSPRIRYMLFLVWAFFVKFSGILSLWQWVKKMSGKTPSRRFRALKNRVMKDVYGDELPRFTMVQDRKHDLTKTM